MIWKSLIVDKKGMRAFLDELYEFVRTADMCSKLIDNCEHKIVFSYGDSHTEIFEGAVNRGHENLESIIEYFVGKYISCEWL